MAEIAAGLWADLPHIGTAYVYVGAAAMDGAMSIIRRLQAEGKKVVMVACDCAFLDKAAFATELGLMDSWIMSECGGRRTCRELVRHLARGVPT